MIAPKSALFHVILLALMSTQVHSQLCTSAIIRNTLEQNRLSSQNLEIEGESIHHAAELYEFYRPLGFEPVWIDAVSSKALVASLKDSQYDGLLPDDYHFTVLTQLLSIGRSPQQEANVDLLLTDAFFTYAIHLWQGKSEPEKLFPGKWDRVLENIDVKEKLLSALRNNSVATSLDSLRPQFAGYARLMNELRKLDRTEWKEITVPPGADLEAGIEDERIRFVKQRLNHIDPSNLCYDSTLYYSIVDFQTRHGLKPDGIIGKRTVDALNETEEVFRKRINVNLERYRWLPRNKPDEYIAVNIPDFSLRLLAGDSVVMSMKAIVGRPERSTPVFNSEIRYLILNPTWTVPPTILKEDVLPAVRRNLKYLERNNLKVIDKNGVELDPTSLPWEKYTYRNFPYQLKQDPGLFNSMGLIKFQFPNQYKVFLHDTNARHLFKQDYRALSSGCIRIERPVELASTLLGKDRWTEKKIEKEIASGKTRTILFDKPVGIYIEYFTVFTDEGGILQVRNDIYGMDPIVLNAIETPLNSRNDQR